MKDHIEPGLKAMLGEKGKLCVSVIVPVDRLAASREQNPVQVRKAVEEACERIDLFAQRQQLDNTEQLKAKLWSLYDRIDFLHAGEGVGLYASENVERMEYFPFPVKRKVQAGASFNVRDLIYKLSMEHVYLLLTLSGRYAHLHFGRLDHLEEIKDGEFPKEFVDDYEYTRPAVASSNGFGLKNTEGDKSAKDQIRLESFYRAADRALDTYLNNGTPLLLAGVVKDLSLFEGVSGHQKNIRAKIEGNFDHTYPRELETAAWQALREENERRRKADLLRLNEQPASALSSGLHQSWTDAFLGRGLKLFVEKDFSQRAHRSELGDQLSVSFHEGWAVMEDAVDDLIELVLEKGGSVQFVENGELSAHGGVALLKRY